VEIENPLEVAQSWERRGAKRLHLVDLDGALGGVRKNESIVREIASTLEIPVEFGGGIRSFEDASNLLDFGIDKIILGTAAIEEPELLVRLSEKYGKERVMIALDSRGGKVVTEGWVKDSGVRAADMAKKVEGHASECLFTNVDVEGLMMGVNLDIINDFVSSTCMGVIASGGISSLRDIEHVKAVGASGVVIGTSLYKGKINFEKALKLQEI
jgi:phosphoribosylformimino-5-aminoimidazole carboxamide ribotide isomerase